MELNSIEVDTRQFGLRAVEGSLELYCYFCGDEYDREVDSSITLHDVLIYAEEHFKEHDLDEDSE